MEINEALAKNIKMLREKKNLSLGQLAQNSGLSKVVLSQLEKGGANPTINTILKVANALEVPYTALLDSLGGSASVVSKSTLPVQTSEDGLYRTYCYYANTAERNFEWFQLELDPGCKYISVGHRARALEYLVVQSGEIIIEINGQRYELAENDSISFQSSLEHHYINTGCKMTIANIINYYPL